MTIQYFVNMEKWNHDINFKYEGRNFDHIRIKGLKKQSFEIVACKNGLPYCSMKKRAKFENGIVSINFGKTVLIVGTYTIIENVSLTN